MKKFAAILLVSLFLGAGTAYAGNVGDSPQQQSMPQGKINIDVHVPEPKTNWQIPVGVAVVTALGGIGVALVRRSRKGN